MDRTKNPLRAVSRITDSWTGCTPLFSRPPGAPPPVHPQHSGAPSGKFEVSGNCHGVITFETFVVVTLLGFTHFPLLRLRMPFTLRCGLMAAGAAGKWGGSLQSKRRSLWAPRTPEPLPPGRHVPQRGPWTPSGGAASFRALFPPAPSVSRTR